jgi:hypothetical protein
LLIVEVEEVGRVVDSVRGLSFTNHQSSITPRVRLFGCPRLLGFSPEGDTSLPVCVSHRTAGPPTPLKARRATQELPLVRKPPEYVFSIGLMIVD